MGDSTFLTTRAALSTSSSYNFGTPSQLTPNTRSEAEAALTANSTTQTDSAAPTTPLPDAGARFEAATLARYMATATNKDGSAGDAGTTDGTVDEAKLTYRRPPNPTRTSTSNYAEALAGSSMTSATKAGVMAAAPAADPRIEVYEPQGGVVPLIPANMGVGMGQAEAVKRAKPTGMSLGELGRKQSWSEQDFKHLYSERLMVVKDGEPGYLSEADE